MQFTTLTFPFSLHPGDVRGFRAAICECLGHGHQLFNGHDNSKPAGKQFSNAYPLVRFGVHKGKARITGMGRGADAIVRHLLPVLPDTLTFANRTVDSSHYDLGMKNWNPELLPQPYTFGLHQWIALNKPNFGEWKKLEGKPAAREMLLSRCLTGHLRALAEAVAPKVDRMEIVAEVLQVDRVKKMTWYHTPLIGFNVVAKANFIPQHGLGLGRCHSFGYGEVCGQKRYEHLSRDHDQEGAGEEVTD
jgi:hypothetical protein